MYERVNWIDHLMENLYMPLELTVDEENETLIVGEQDPLIFQQGTPLDAEHLNRMDAGIFQLDTNISAIQSQLADLNAKYNALAEQVRAEGTVIPATAAQVSAPNGVELTGAGDTAQIFARLTPANSTDTVTWSSSNEAVAIVTPDMSSGSSGAGSTSAMITAVGPGTATITATTSSGVIASTTITVGADSGQTDLPIQSYNNVVRMDFANFSEGDNRAWTVLVNSLVEYVTFTSSNNDIAKPESAAAATTAESVTVAAVNGKARCYIFPRSSGSCTVTATTDTGHSVTLTVTASQVTVSEMLFAMEGQSTAITGISVRRGSPFSLDVLMLPKNNTDTVDSWVSNVVIGGNKAPFSITKISQEEITDSQYRRVRVKYRAGQSSDTGTGTFIVNAKTTSHGVKEVVVQVAG